MADLCPVCLDEDRVAWALGVCGHRVCSPCMDKIVIGAAGRQARCPVCRGVVMWWMKDGVPTWVFRQKHIDAATIEAGGGPRWITQLARVACEPLVMASLVIQGNVIYFTVPYISHQPWHEHLDSLLGWLRTALETHMGDKYLCENAVSCLVNLSRPKANYSSLVQQADLVRRVLVHHVGISCVVVKCLTYYLNIASEQTGKEVLLGMALEAARWLVSVVQRHEATPVVMQRFLFMVKNLSRAAVLDTSAALRVFVSFVLTEITARRGDPELHSFMTPLVALAALSSNTAWLRIHAMPVVRTVLDDTKDTAAVSVGLDFVHWIAYYSQGTDSTLADIVFPTVWICMKTYKTNEKIVKLCMTTLSCLQYGRPSVKRLLWQPAKLKTLRKAASRFINNADIIEKFTFIVWGCVSVDKTAGCQVFDVVKTVMALHSKDEDILNNCVAFFGVMSHRSSSVALERLWDVESCMYAAAKRLCDSTTATGLVFYCNLAELDVAKRPLLAEKLPWVCDMLHRFVACRRGDLYWKFIARVMTPPNWPTLLSLLSVTMATPGVVLDTVRYGVQCIAQFAAADIDAGSDIYALLWQGVLPWLKSAVCRHDAACVELVDACMSIACRVTKPTPPWPEKYVLMVLDLVQACVTAQGADTEVARQCAECLHGVLTTHRHWADSAPLTALLRQLQAEHGDVAAVVDVCVARPHKQVRVA
jgi:hypothetical protein